MVHLHNRKAIFKRGQVAIFALIAIAIIFLAFLIYFLRPMPIEPLQPTLKDPKAILESCITSAFHEAEPILLSQGGYFHVGRFIRYAGKNISYLCLNEGYVSPCIRQHIFIISDLNNQLQIYFQNISEECFLQTKIAMRQLGAEMELAEQNVNVSLAHKQVNLHIEREVSVTLKEEQRRYSSFDFSFASPLYDFGEVSEAIVNEETKYCNFDYVGYNLLHPSIKITKELSADSSKIYTLIDSATNKSMPIAIRGCVTPKI